MKKARISIVFIVLILAKAEVCFSQQKLDLEDVNIKGELLGDNRIQMLNRQRSELKNFVEYRTNYRKEMIQELERPYPKYREF